MNKRQDYLMDTTIRPILHEILPRQLGKIIADGPCLVSGLTSTYVAVVVNNVSEKAFSESLRDANIGFTVEALEAPYQRKVEITIPY